MSGFWDSVWRSSRRGQQSLALVLRLFAPAIWLSGRLSFSRKYLLIGVVVLVALASLSMPLWQQVRQARHSADTERAGLRVFALQAEVLAVRIDTAE